jgi:hypothetical protein
MQTDKTQDERLGTGLRWGNIGATDPVQKRKQQAAVRQKIQREWEEAQAYWKAYRAARHQGVAFQASA